MGTFEALRIPNINDVVVNTHQYYDYIPIISHNRFLQKYEGVEGGGGGGITILQLGLNSQLNARGGGDGGGGLRSQPNAYGADMGKQESVISVTHIL